MHAVLKQESNLLQLSVSAYHNGGETMQFNIMLAALMRYRVCTCKRVQDDAI